MTDYTEIQTKAVCTAPADDQRDCTGFRATTIRKRCRHLEFYSRACGRQEWERAHGHSKKEGE
ncbi:MAG TPA: hypothetical protein VJZ49_15485 [Syntrophales bacterium]|nr:hypothetical protein [Syntrophales bacterium]